MRILIVGCGYVGRPLGADLARRGHEVFGLRRNPAAENELKRVGIQPLLADVTDAASLKRLPRDFDWVINCAASGGGDAASYRQLYLEGNRNLIHWLEGSAVKKFVYTSSTSVYAQNDGSAVTEGSPTEPESPTARVLVETEKLLLTAAKQNFPAVILRVAGIYGPDRGHAFRQFLKGEARIEGDGSRLLNMIHQADVAGAIMAALDRGGPGEVYNAVDNEPVTQLNFFSWLATVLNQAPPPMIPADPMTGRKRGITNKRVINKKLCTELNYSFRFPDFRAGYGAEIGRRKEDMA